MKSHPAPVGPLLILSLRPTAEHHETARVWLVWSALTLVALVAASRVQPDAQLQAQGQLIGRCTAAFSAQDFAPARRLLGLGSVFEGSYRVLNSEITQDAGRQQATFWARLLTPAGELHRAFVCQSAGLSSSDAQSAASVEDQAGVTFRLAQ